MSDILDPVIRDIANTFRTAIEAVPPAQRPLILQRFPVGACGTACILLGAYFQDLGITGFDYIPGERGEVADNSWETHAWLQRGDTVVDITVDQFDGEAAAVFVGTLANSGLHGSFETDPPHPADFRDYDEHTVEALAPMYAMLREQLGDLDGRARPRDRP